MPIYTKSQLKTSLNGRIHNKSGLLSSIDTTINDAVREVVSSVDLRSSKRKASTAPNLFNDIYQYACPTDLKGYKIISLQPQNYERSEMLHWDLTTEDEFDRRKGSEVNLLSFSDRDMVRKLLCSASSDDDGFTISSLDSTSGWAVFGDGENLSLDSHEFIKGSGSLKYDISSAGGTTAGIYNASLPTFDLTNYKSNGSVFVWAWITSTTNLTNFIIRLGNDSSNYYSVTVTTTNEGASFSNGWNLLRFDLSGKSTTGTVDDDTCDYAAIYMTKTAGKISETDYRFDHLIVKLGSIHNLIYYSKYLWQNSSGTYLENSTADTDYLNVDTEEYSMIIEKCVEWASAEIREDADKIAASAKFTALRRDYRKTYRGEALPIVNSYYHF